MSGSGVTDDRVIFRFEAAWDSSLHNSLLLNRVTPAGETIYMTISAYLELENCASPAIVTKDLAMLVYGRDGRLGPRLKHLFQGTFRNPEANRLTGIYEIVMKRAQIGSPGKLLLSNQINAHMFCCLILLFANGQVNNPYLNKQQFSFLIII